MPADLTSELRVLLGTIRTLGAAVELTPAVLWPVEGALAALPELLYRLPSALYHPTGRQLIEALPTTVRPLRVLIGLDGPIPAARIAAAQQNLRAALGPLLVLVDQLDSHLDRPGGGAGAVEGGEGGGAG